MLEFVEEVEEVKEVKEVVKGVQEEVQEKGEEVEEKVEEEKVEEEDNNIPAVKGYFRGQEEKFDKSLTDYCIVSTSLSFKSIY